jgi:hypothetical protein
MLAVLAGCYYFEVRQLERLALPYGKYLAFGLAVIVALLAGSLDELVAMHLRRGQPATLVENERVDVSGRLRPLGGLVTSPVSGRQVLMYEYMWRETGLTTGEYRSAAAMMRGIAMAPCELVTPQGPIRIEGFANLENFTEETLDARRATAAMEERIRRGQWKRVGANILEARKVLDTPMGIEGGVMDFLNASADTLFGRCV